MVNFKDEADLRVVCYKFKEHLEAVIGPALTDMLRSRGLPAVEIRNPDVLAELGRVQASVTKGNSLSADNIAFIVKHVIRDPSGALTANNSELSKAVRKYTSLTNLLATKTEHEFKVSYINDFLKNVGRDNDSATQNFVKKISGDLKLVMHNGAKSTKFSHSSNKPSNDNVVVGTLKLSRSKSSG
jgi:hypothetical protein